MNLLKSEYPLFFNQDDLKTDYFYFLNRDFHSGNFSSTKK